MPEQQISIPVVDEGECRVNFSILQLVHEDVWQSGWNTSCEEIEEVIVSLIRNGYITATINTDKLFAAHEVRGEVEDA